MSKGFNQLIEVSHKYGSNSNFVLHGGGNTSFKDEDFMYVKASGHSLGNIDEKGFVKMNLKKMNSIFTNKYSKDDDEREEQVLKDMMNCRVVGETGRPSVEALLHSLIPYSFVIHTHPSLVNGMTCGVNGKEICSKLFPDSLWIGLVKPGYVLAAEIKNKAEEFKKQKGFFPKLIFLQNHGIFVSGANIEEIDETYKDIVDKLNNYVVRQPNIPDLNEVYKIQKALNNLGWGDAIFIFNDELKDRISDYKSFEAISKPYTPDHIVYSGAFPLFFEKENLLKEKISEEIKYKIMNSKIICVKGLCAFAKDIKARDLFLDTLKIACYNESFGGNQFLEDWMISFISNWEVEKYRRNVK